MFFLNISYQYYRYYLMSSLSIVSLSLLSMQNPHEKFFYQSKTIDIPQIKIDTQAKSKSDNFVMPAIIHSSQSALQKVTITLANNSILNSSKTNPDAIKQYDKSMEAYEKISSSKSSVEISELKGDLRNFEFLFCFEHMDDIFLATSPADGVATEERFLKIINDKETIARLGNNSEMLNKIEHYKKQIEAAKLAQSICQKSLSSADSNADKKTLIDLWYEAQGNHDLKNRITRRTHSAFASKVAGIMKDQLRNTNLANLGNHQLVKMALEMQEMRITNSAFYSFLDTHPNDNGKFLMLRKNCESMLKKQYGDIQLTLLDINQKRFNIRGSQLFYPPANHKQMEIQKEVIIKLGKLNWERISILDDVANDIARLAINLSQENKIQEANLAIGFLDEMSNFKDGSFQTLADEVSKFKQNIKENWELNAEIIGGGAALTYLCPPAGLIYSGVMLGFGLASNTHEFVSNVQSCYDSVIKGDSFKMGQEFTKLGINSLNLTLLYKSFHHMFKTARANGQLTQCVEEVNNGVRTLVEVNSIRQELIATSEYSKLMASATNRGMSQQAWDRRVNDLCMVIENPREIINKLQNLDRGSHIIRSNNIPQGMTQRLIVYVDHIDRPEFNRNGKLTGFHFDCNNTILNGGKVKFTNITRADNGMYSANITINGITKPQKNSLFCNIRNTNVHSLSQEVINTLEQLDFSNTRFKNSQYQLLLTSDNTFHVKINDFQGGVLFAKINKLTGEINTYYPGHNDLGNNINIIKD